MGLNFSKEPDSAPADTTERQGYTRIEPAFGRSGNTREASSNLNSSAIRTFPGRDGGSIKLKNNVISCTWKNGVKEITIIRDMIIIQDDFDSKMELEGSHDFQIEGFHIRTRRILERSNGKHGYCLGIDTTALDANTFEITNENELEVATVGGSIETNLKIKAKKQSEVLNMQILVKNELRHQQDTSSSSGSSSTPASVSIAPVNSSGIVWVRTYY